MRDLIERLTGLHDKIANSSPQLRRGQVWCHTCGHTERVNSADCLRHGWPRHCGYTMSIDSPQKRAALKAREDAK